ncbi:unnamed protein product [Oncorhynchus mykiss]|uniref:Tc1-like transposase DDE domain-containing protein n=1 Tax=Oncorhynchus mykiss TaxID=8022 RepID=A0A060YG22_ONCMY|nr:unnamed protein product [Oncorhynchus mykiss]
MLARFTELLYDLYMCGSHREALRRRCDGVGVLCWTMTQHTSRQCKGYLTKKERGEVLHQMTWPPQSPNLNPIEVWDELDRRVKEKQQVLSICGNSFKTVGKAFQVKLVERMPRVCKAVIKARGGYFEESEI